MSASLFMRMMVILIAIPGAIADQGAARKASLPDASMIPQSGIEGSPPKPSKLKAALLMTQ